MCDVVSKASTSFEKKQRKMTKSMSSSNDSDSQREGMFEADPSMKTEIEAAVGFLTDFLVKAPKQEFSQESVDLFRRSLKTVLYRQYNGHWHSANPLKGSGFRCLRINGKLDPLVTLAAEASRLPLRKVRQAFPAELTVWVDPGDVSVRFGEEGSIGVWYATRRSGDEEKTRLTSELLDHHHQQQQQHHHQMPAYQQMYQRSSPTLSSTPPHQMAGFAPHGGLAYHAHHRVQYQASPIQYQRQQSSPVWNPQWQQQQPQAQSFSPQQPQHHSRSSPSSFVLAAPSSSTTSASSSSGNNGFMMALNHQQQQMQLRQQANTTPIRYGPHHSSSSTSTSSRVSPQPTTAAESSSTSQLVENGEEQRCKMLAERLMRENINLMASLAPGLVSSRSQPVGVGVN